MIVERTVNVSHMYSNVKYTLDLKAAYIAMTAQRLDIISMRCFVVDYKSDDLPLY